MADIYGVDAYAPKEVAERVEKVGVTKARLPFLSQVTLGILGGGFIGFGALYYTLVISDSGLGFAASRLLGGFAFSLGLILVVIAGAELFTGNNLQVMAWTSREISTRRAAAATGRSSGAPTSWGPPAWRCWWCCPTTTP